MELKAVVDFYVSDYATSSRCQALLDAGWMRSHGLKTGQIVRLRTERNRSVLARLMEAAGTPGHIQLDRFLRQALKARLNETISIEPVNVESVKKVVLRPAIDVSTAHHLLPHIKATLVNSEAPLDVGSIVYITFPHSVAGTTYEVESIFDRGGIVTEETDVELAYHDAHLPEGAFDITFEDVGGLERQMRLVRELVQLPLQMPYIYRQLGINPPRGIIFYGPPGTGKTHLARAVANEVEARFYYINGPDIIGTYSGETEGNLRRMFNEAAHHSPSIIFIDELDALAPKRGETGAHSDTRAVTQLLALMDGLKRVDGVIVIGTTNRVDSIDPALRRPGRFDREIFFGPPDQKGRLEILQIHTREMPLSAEALQYLPELARNTHGFVGADLMELCREAGLNAMRRSASALTDPRRAFRIQPEAITIEKADFQMARSQVQPSALRETLITVPDVSWEDIGGLEEIKQRLIELIEKPLQHPEAFTEMGLHVRSGILLHGPPGTGKTLLAKAIANECGINFIPVEGPELFTKWLGETEETLRQIFRIARQVAPSIIFFDQLDAVASIRGQYTGSKSTERVVNQLLAELDGIEPLDNVIVIGATNRLNLIDPSVLRPGRFGIHILVPLPDEEDRRQILRIKLRGVRLKPGITVEMISQQLAPRTEGFSGADLDHLCQEAKLLALRENQYTGAVEMSFAHFERALERIAPANQREEVGMTV
ncbi:MAG: AAA family ATPase [Acidobacteria bacterium]|nr:MAG: AAA family ATPase [Acidobacteriota bacterium]